MAEEKAAATIVSPTARQMLVGPLWAPKSEGVSSHIELPMVWDSSWDICGGLFNRVCFSNTLVLARKEVPEIRAEASLPLLIPWPRVPRIVRESPPSAPKSQGWVTEKGEDPSVRSLTNVNFVPSHERLPQQQTLPPVCQEGAGSVWRCGGCGRLLLRWILISFLFYKASASAFVIS